MHITIITFGLRDLDADAYRELCGEVAPAFAELPGLISKTWLADEERGVYGGVYVWRDRAAFEAYTRSELFAGVEANPHFTDVAVRDFGVLEAPSAVTRAAVPAAA
jgi:heme-degrading monooxygenase HmoA